MVKTYNIERNKLDYILTDIVPVELSELFSLNGFYCYLLQNRKKLEAIQNDLMIIKSRNNIRMFEGEWDTVPLKYPILKGTDGIRELNLLQPLSVLNIYFFMECYQKEMLVLMDENACFSLRYHKKNNDLCYKKKVKQITEYFEKTSRKLSKGVIQQTGAYFTIYKYNSVASFTNSKVWQHCNYKYKYFAKIDYKSCFDSIYTHAYKWIIERNVVDSKEAKNSNLFITIDRILQNINAKSSNGLVVGPEFSRLIAEILLQYIDIDVKTKLSLLGLSQNIDYNVFRYVDDIYIFANNPEEIDLIIQTFGEAAGRYLLKINDNKSLKCSTPFILNTWLSHTRNYTSEIAKLFLTKKKLISSQRIVSICYEMDIFRWIT